MMNYIFATFITDFFHKCNKMDYVFDNYTNTYIKLLPKELKDMLRFYVYGRFIVRLIYDPKTSPLNVRVYAVITEKSYTVASIPMEFSDLLKYSKIKLPMHLTSMNYALRSDTKFFRINNDNSIIIGEDPQIVIDGQDFYTFMAKLRQMYNDIDNDVLKSDRFYYY